MQSPPVIASQLLVEMRKHVDKLLTCNVQEWRTIKTWIATLPMWNASTNLSIPAGIYLMMWKLHFMTVLLNKVKNTKEDIRCSMTFKDACQKSNVKNTFNKVVSMSLGEEKLVEHLSWGWMSKTKNLFEAMLYVSLSVWLWKSMSWRLWGKDFNWPSGDGLVYSYMSKWSSP